MFGKFNGWPASSSSPIRCCVNCVEEERGEDTVWHLALIMVLEFASTFLQAILNCFYVSCLDDCKRKRLRILNNFCFNILLYENLNGNILDKTYFQMLKMIIAFVIQYYQHRFYLNNLLYKLKLELSKYELVIWICICYCK